MLKRTQKICVKNFSVKKLILNFTDVKFLNHFVSIFFEKPKLYYSNYMPFIYIWNSFLEISCKYENSINLKYNFHLQNACWVKFQQMVNRLCLIVSLPPLVRHLWVSKVTTLCALLIFRKIMFYFYLNKQQNFALIFEEILTDAVF